MLDPRAPVGQKDRKSSCLLSNTMYDVVVHIDKLPIYESLRARVDGNLRWCQPAASCLLDDSTLQLAASLRSTTALVDATPS